MKARIDRSYISDMGEWQKGSVFATSQKIAKSF